MAGTPPNSIADDEEWPLVFDEEECIRRCPQLVNRPPDDEPWTGGLVPAEEFDANTSLWAHVQNLPPVHVGKTPDAQHYLVAVGSSCVDGLYGIGCTSVLGFSASPACSRVWEPSHGEVYVHGTTTARQMAQRCFVGNAAKGIRGHARGLGRFYQHITEGWMFLAVQWTILIEDIMAASPEIVNRFLRICLFAILQQFNTIRPRPLESCETILQWNREPWLHRLSEYGKNRIEWLAQQTGALSDEVKEAEIHKISLPCGLFQFAGSDDRHEEKRCVHDNDVGILCDLFQLTILIASEPLRLLSSKPIIASELLLQWRPLQCLEKDVIKLQQQIHLHLPIELSDEYSVLRSSLIDSIDDGVNLPTDSALVDDNASDAGSISSELTHFTDLSGLSEQQ